MHSARQPLVIIGKGAAWARAEAQVRRFVAINPSAARRPQQFAWLTRS